MEVIQYCIKKLHAYCINIASRNYMRIALTRFKCFKKKKILQKSMSNSQFGRLKMLMLKQSLHARIVSVHFMEIPLKHKELQKTNLNSCEVETCWLWTFLINARKTFKCYQTIVSRHICFHLYILLRFYGFPYLPFSPLVLAYA